MFNRLSKIAFICLRCQSRLFRSQQPFPSSNLIQQPSTAARWLGTAIARAEDEDEFEGHRPQEDATAHDRPLERKPPRRGKWRHSQVAELGVPSLGRPAEVLVLQPRDRRIRRVPDGDVEEDKPDLVEAYEAEIGPLNPEHVKENIEQIRKPFGHGKRTLERDEWKALKQNLVQGFTHLQLLEYVRQMEPTSKSVSEQKRETASSALSTQLQLSIKNTTSSSRQTKVKGRDRVKRLAAAYILKDIWGFSRPSEDEIEDWTCSTIQMQPYQTRTIMRHPSLRQVAEERKVKVDIYSQDKNTDKVVFEGSSNAIAEVKKVVRLLRTQLNAVTIDLGKAKHLLPQLCDSKYENEVLQHITSNRHIFISPFKKKNSTHFFLRLYYHESERNDAEAARRDLLLAGLGPRQSSNFSVWPPLEHRSTWLVPHNSWNTFSWWEANRLWGRWGYLPLADERGSKLLSTSDGPTLEQAKEILRYLKGSKLTSESLVPAATVRLEYTAQLGQTLFRRNTKQALGSILAKHERSRQPNPDPRLLVDVPLLAQFLTSRKPWSDGHESAGKSSPSTPRKTRFIHRLHLLPTADDPSAPPLEVYLSGEDARQGLRQPLHIFSISAILEERSHFHLQPELPVDINFIRQTKYDFYPPIGKKKDPKNHLVNAQVLQYLNLAQGLDVPRFAPFVKLNIPAELADRFKPARNPASMPSDETNKTRTSSLENSIAAASSKSTLSTHRTASREYMLAASETVDIVSYSYSELCLNNIYFHNDMDGISGRQELRLAEQPFLESQKETGFETFHKIFKGACALAARLGDTKGLKKPT